MRVLNIIHGGSEPWKYFYSDFWWNQLFLHTNVVVRIIKLSFNNVYNVKVIIFKNYYSLKKLTRLKSFHTENCKWVTWYDLHILFNIFSVHKQNLTHTLLKLNLTINYWIS